jgi:hypothetical protein
MENQFIPYEEALALKELGFEESCFAWYVSDNYGLEFGKVIQSDLISDGIIAPLYQQAFEWFRNHHSLFVNFLTRTSVNEILETDVSIVSWKFPPRKIDYFIRYDDARLEALKALISILKDEERSK